MAELLTLLQRVGHFVTRKKYFRPRKRSPCHLDPVTEYVAHTALRAMLLKPVLLLMAIILCFLPVKMFASLVQLFGVLVIVMLLPKLVVLRHLDDIPRIMFLMVADFVQYTPESLVGTMRVGQALWAFFTGVSNWTPQASLEAELKKLPYFYVAIRELWPAVMLACIGVGAAWLGPRSLMNMIVPLTLLASIIVLPFYVTLTMFSPSHLNPFFRAWLKRIVLPKCRKKPTHASPAPKGDSDSSDGDKGSMDGKGNTDKAAEAHKGYGFNVVVGEEDKKSDEDPFALLPAHIEKMATDAVEQAEGFGEGELKTMLHEARSEVDLGLLVQAPGGIGGASSYMSARTGTLSGIELTAAGLKAAHRSSSMSQSGGLTAAGPTPAYRATSTPAQLLSTPTSDDVSAAPVKRAWKANSGLYLTRSLAGGGSLWGTRSTASVADAARTTSSTSVDGGLRKHKSVPSIQRGRRAWRSNSDSVEQRTRSSSSVGLRGEDSGGLVRAGAGVITPAAAAAAAAVAGTAVTVTSAGPAAVPERKAWRSNSETQPKRGIIKSTSATNLAKPAAASSVGGYTSDAELAATEHRRPAWSSRSLPGGRPSSGSDGSDSSGAWASVVRFKLASDVVLPDSDGSDTGSDATPFPATPAQGSPATAAGSSGSDESESSPFDGSAFGDPSAGAFLKRSAFAGAGGLSRSTLFTPGTEGVQRPGPKRALGTVHSGAPYMEDFQPLPVSPFSHIAFPDDKRSARGGSSSSAGGSFSTPASTLPGPSIGSSPFSSVDSPSTPGSSPAGTAPDFNSISRAKAAMARSHSLQKTLHPFVKGSSLPIDEEVPEGANIVLHGEDAIVKPGAKAAADVSRAERAGQDMPHTPSSAKAGKGWSLNRRTRGSKP